MFRMDSPLSPESCVKAHRRRILLRLSRLEVPEEYLDQGPSGLVAYAKTNKYRVAELVTAILPTHEDAMEASFEPHDGNIKDADEDIFHESMVWLMWLMFEGEPKTSLDHLAKINSSNHGICGAVWGSNEIAYRCQTCAQDPTCGICVPCFENGDHKDHDYCMIYTTGGCCDCGDITAWKREGFCLKHKGIEQIKPLPEEFAKSLGPVVDALLNYWKQKLKFAEINSKESYDAKVQHTSDELTLAVVEALLLFCRHSESLLCFISRRVCSSFGLLEVLLQAEMFTRDGITGKLHELLLKLLGEPIFKYEFAKAFLRYYPTIINEAIKECSDTIFKKYPLLPIFSVQIFPLPSLTSLLIEDMNLLPMLLGCLGNIFISCAGEDGKLEVSKWESLYETTFRVVEDIRLVMNHSIAPKYICQGRLDLVRTWMKLLAFVQGMSPQKRAIAGHVEDSDDNMHLTFFLSHSLMKILSILVAEAFSVTSIEETNKQSKTEFEDQDGPRHAKIRKSSRESSFSSITGKSTLRHASSAAELNIGSFPLPSSGLWLTFECLRAIDSWLGVDNTVGCLGVSSSITSEGSVNNPCGLRATLCKFGTDRDIFKSCTAPFPNGNLTSLSEVLGKQGPLPSNSGSLNGVDFESEQYMGLGVVSGGSVGNMLERESVAELEGLKALSLSYWPDIIYDVSSQNISAQIPLHRLLSMILQIALKQCYGESAPSSLVSSNSADPSSVPRGNFFDHILGGCHPYGFSAFLMEHPLQIRVFFAEVRSGMWCRNGDDPTVSIECYRSVPCSELGQDLDLFLLQCCAALAPPDLYVRRILERFGLLNYLSLNLERSSEHEPALVVEMLTLLIQIVKERRYSGLTATECLQKELIYKLSIGDATRSQLVESLPHDLCTISELQEIVDTVAEYSSPSGLIQGKYKLRSAYGKELDLYHPCLNSRDLQASVERYFRVFGTSAFTSQLPKWTKIYYPLRVIAQVATCKAVLEIIRAVIFYAVFADRLAVSRAPDDVVLISLHLLALALDICQVEKISGHLLCDVSDPTPILGFACEEICVNKSGDQSMISLLVLLMRIHEKEDAKNFMEAGNFNFSSMIRDILKKFAELEPGCMTKLKKLAPGLIDRHSQSLASGYSNGTGSDSDREKSKMKAQERQAAILEKMRAQQRKFLASINSSADDINDSKSGQDICDSCVENNPLESAQAICSLCRGQNSSSPVSFLVLLQKSRLLSLVERGSPSWEQVSCPEKEPASKRTNRTNELPQRSSSISGGSGMISSSQSLIQSIKNVQFPYISKNTREKTVFSLETLEEHMYFKIRGVIHAISWELDSRSKDDFSSVTGGSLESSDNAESLLSGIYTAGVLKETWKNPMASENVNSRSIRARSESKTLHPEDDGFGPIGSDGICVSSCGHAVHQRCLDGYLSSHRGWHDEGGRAVDPDEGEFLCPLCRGLANCVLPASFRDLRRFPQSPAISAVDSTDADSPSTSSDRDAAPFRLQDALSILKSAADVARNNEIQKVFPVHQNVRARPDLELMFRVVSAMYFPGEDKMLESSGISHAIILWDALKYSITSAEIAARSRNNSLSANYSLSALYKEVNSTNGFMLSLLLNATKSLRTDNSLCVLLRLRGTQLFAESICFGTPPNKYSNYRWQLEGNMLYIMDNADAEIQFPDIQLWELASEPVLARDAFASLMWTLFCLPWPFLSCEESYRSLVHAFYLVNVTKAIITYCKSGQFNISEFGNQDCLITDIYKFVGNQGEAQHHIDTNYINPSYDVKDTIRSLSFPYLRRCAFLWKIINHSNSVPFSDMPNQLDVQLSVANDVMESDNIELYEVEKLEKRFNIPPLGVIINDEKSRLAALRWLHHLSEGSEAQNVYSGLNCTPAVPFCLIRLPRLYQDVLQRYVKKHCPDCGTVPEEPALCLLCGKLCSPNWKPCCRASDCRTHGMACGAGIAVFLLIRRTAILLQRSAHQTLWPSPYLDAFGEEDTEMQRGKPLFLSEERYPALAHMVASHGLDPSSKLYQ